MKDQEGRQQKMKFKKIGINGRKEGRKEYNKKEKKMKKKGIIIGQNK